MRIVHMNLFKTVPAGVFHQLAAEHDAARALELDWEVCVYSGDLPTAPWQVHTPYAGWGGYLRARLQFFRAVLAAQRAGHIVLLRYSLADPIQALFAGWFQRVVTIHHTFEIEESEQTGCIKGHLKAAIERHLGLRTLARSTGLIAVTAEIAAYEQARLARRLPALVVANGIDLSAQPLAADARDGVPKLLFVASRFAAWHGLDLLLDATERSSAAFELYLVGELPNAERERAARDPRISCTGHLAPDAIAALMGRCDLGLSTLALARKGMREACTLKVREYLAGGLPCWADHQDSALPADFPFMRQGGAELAGMLSFALAMRQQSRAEVRRAAAAHIDKTGLLGRTAAFIQSLYERVQARTG